ncbi:hypothetical protein [Mesorhizobium sp. CAU 1741]|uniref:hypothetical protein n=1 Tax=Mesorhizobium sp. CAU 1741 TaxID=3140366 RepID=UPI00325AF536
MAFFSRNDDALDLHHQIAALRKEVASLSRSAGKKGASAYHGASDSASEFYGDLADRVAGALPVIRRRAHDIEDTIRENPTRTAAAVGLVALVVTAALLMGNRRR